MIRNLDGLAFQVRCPSYYELVGAPISLAFLGDRWYLFVANADGTFSHHAFAGRDEAVGLVKRVVNKVGFAQ